MKLTLRLISEHLGTRLEALEPNLEISGLATLEQAQRNEISFLTSPQYRPHLEITQASAVILNDTDAEFCKTSKLISQNPRLALAKLAKLFDDHYRSHHRPQTGIHPSAVIGNKAQIGKDVSIAANAVIGDEVVLETGVVIGPGVCIGNQVTLKEQVFIGPGSILGNQIVIQAGTRLTSRVTLYNGVKIGQNCLIHSGVVIGADGFGFAQEEGKWIKIPHLASVVIGENVEIGANTTIDKGFLENTQIGNGVIIDNLVQIGHNVKIGDNTAIAGCVGIAGSAIIGSNCMIAGGALIAGHLEITDGVIITASTGVNHSISKPGVYSAGLPAKPNAIWRKNAARFQYLDDMAKRIRVLEQKLNIGNGNT